MLNLSKSIDYGVVGGGGSGGGVLRGERKYRAVQIDHGVHRQCGQNSGSFSQDLRVVLRSGLV